MLEEPLLEVLLDDLRAAAPAGAVDHLLVGQHRLAARAPVHRRTPAVGQAALEHADEQPLVPVVVVGQARGQLALPGVADAEALQLPLHVRDVVEGRGLGVDAALDGGVLRRQAERVPPERVQHVEALQPFQPGDDVADDVVADVADVRVSRGIREHLQAVELRHRRVFDDLEGARVAPAGLPFRVECLRMVVGHKGTVSVRSATDARPRVSGNSNRSLQPPAHRRQCADNAACAASAARRPRARSPLGRPGAAAAPAHTSIVAWSDASSPSRS